MGKAEFTVMVGQLILWLDNEGLFPLLDYAFRSAGEQNRLYDEGKSKCDGIKNISAHQYRDAGGRYAVDIYIHDGDGDIGKREPYERAHDYWSTMGGKPMIKWDWGHFEV